MKKMKKIWTFTFVLPLLLSSCGEQTYPIESYVLETAYKDNYRILYLTDIHFGMTTNLDENARWFDNLIEASNPDMIIVGGDSFMDATTREVDYLFDYMDGVGLPWSIIWGNHDKQGWYSPSYLLNALEDRENLLFVNYKDDDVYGDSNYAVDLKDENGETVWRIVLMDSNSYYDMGDLTYKYDVVHENQVEWYRNIIEYDNGTEIPSVLFLHIPLVEFDDAIEGALNGEYDYIGELREGIAHGYRSSGLYEAIEELGSTKGVFVGHDHINTMAVDYNDIILAYVIKSTNLIYHDKDLLGGQIVELPRISVDEKLSLESIESERYFMSYE